MGQPDKTLPTHVERPDLYDSFDGLKHEPNKENPVAIPDRLKRRIFHKSIPVDPELQAKLKKSFDEVKAMSPKEYEKMKKIQGQSWAKQIMD